MRRRGQPAPRACPLPRLPGRVPCPSPATKWRDRSSQARRALASWGVPPFGDIRQYTNSARAFNTERCSFRSGRAAEHARVRHRMGETRVDLLHLLEDLRDAYPGALEETILTEIVANSLDSGARRIQLAADAATAGLVVVDDGSGMRRRELARYHDIASSAKTRGQGIGFAGVGIKLGLLVCEEVLTETRRGKTHVATRWHLASHHRAPWKWIPPLGMVAERGTAVRLRLRNPLSPLLDAGFVEAVLRRHYQPLFDAFFAPVLVPCYPRGVTVEVNGRALEPEEVALETAPLEIREARKRKPSALGYLMRAPEPLPEERRGLAISTLGKVISLLPGASGARRPAHHALSIQFEERPGDPELGRLVESTVWVNAAHPAYRRAAASRSDGYHIALAAALALAPLAVEPAHEHAFVTAFLTRWGDAVGRDRPAARSSR